ncbi:MAG: sugar ABC transporter permease [Trueperaceae bacterium]|nr:sugar ABC transporter permease [Trueperaceae bacterium]
MTTQTQQAAAREIAKSKPPSPSPSRALRGKQIAPYLFLAPALLFGIVFLLLPLGFSLYLTFTRWNPLSTPRWVGPDQYRYLLSDPTFLSTLGNTMIFALGTVFVGVPLALIIAYAFTFSRGRSVWRTLYWLPMVTNVVAVGYLWQYLLDGTYGLVNVLLGYVGINGPAWLSDPGAAMAAVIIVAVWMGIGQNMLLFSAGIEGLNTTLFEAARIDGANAIQVFWYIALPLLRPTLLFVTVTSFIAGMGSFSLILVLTEGGPMNATNVTALYMYQTAFQDLRMGRAAAMAFILFVLIFIVTLVQLRVFRRGGVEAY